MSILSAGLFDDPITQDDLAPSGAGRRSAVIEDAIQSLPGMALLNLSELDTARARGALAFRQYQPDEAKAFLDENGVGEYLTLENRPYNQLELSILTRRKQAEIKRQYVMQRSQGGFAQGAERLGLNLATQLLDPLAIATAFVPVVSEARYAAWLERAGTSALKRTGVRVAAGGAEGAVGTAIVEPLIFTSKDQEQADYGLTDSFLNIAFGGVFGGGLHAVGGAIGDRLRRPGERVPDRMGAVAEAAPDAGAAASEPARPLGPDPFATPATLAERLRTDEGLRADLQQFRNETGQSERGGQMIRATEDTSSRDYAKVTGRTVHIAVADWWDARPFTGNSENRVSQADVETAIDKALAGEKLGSKQQEIIQYLTDVADERQRLQGHQPTEDELADYGLGGPSDAFEAAYVARASDIDEATVERLALQHEGRVDFLRAVKEFVDGHDRIAAPAGRSAQDSAAPGTAEGPRAAAEKAGLALPETREAAMRAAVAQDQTGRAIDVEPIFQLDPATRTQSIDQTLRDLRGDEPAPIADMPPIEEAADQAAVDQQYAELADELAAMERELALDETELPDSIRAELEAADAEVAELDLLTKAARLAVSCAMRHSA